MSVDGLTDRVGVRRLHLSQFRNYESLDLELGEGFNVFVGANAQGKTNLLEALYWLSTTRLLRGSKDSEGIREGAEATKVEAEIAPHGTKISLQLAHGARKRALVNGLGLPRAADLLGRMPCVCVSSEDLLLARGEPSDRRTFLDLQLSSQSPAYLRHLTSYKRAVEQRNALLKSAHERSVGDFEFEPWEEEMARDAAYMRSSRQDYISRLIPLAHEYHGWMGQGESLDLRYVAKDECERMEEFVEALAKTRREDIRRGTTSIGPHRDDLLMFIDNRDVRQFGSQGQQRTAVLAFKMAILKNSKLEEGCAPLLLLDDVLGELDAQRRQALAELVAREGDQIVLTCTEAPTSKELCGRGAAFFTVSAGRILDS